MSLNLSVFINLEFLPKALPSKEELLVKMKRMMAHKIVVQNHNLSTARDYYDSLNEDRSPRIIQGLR
jgi:hypothetical protein